MVRRLRAWAAAALEAMEIALLLVAMSPFLVLILLWHWSVVRRHPELDGVCPCCWASVECDCTDDTSAIPASSL